MTTPRIRRSTLPVSIAHSAPAAAIPQIVIKLPRGAVAECPVDSHLVTDILKATPKIRRGNRKDGYTHVSDLIGKNKCTRKMALADKFGTPVRPNRLSIFDRIVFAIGDAIHDTVKKIASEGGPSMVWGNWRCNCGHLYHEDPCTAAEIDSEDICPLCQNPTHIYNEVPIFNEEYLIVGNPDLVLWLTIVNAFHIVELKSMAHEQWEELVRPLPEHVLQVLFYWFLMAMSGRRVTDRVSIVYITKGYRFKGEATKEFMIDPRAELHRLMPYLDDAMRVKLSKSSNVFPIRKICSGEMSTTARKCEVCKPCFTLPNV